MDLNELIDRIGYIRSKANLSARKLSLAIGKNAGYIHMLETNRNLRLRLKRLRRFWKYAGWSGMLFSIIPSPLISRIKS